MKAAKEISETIAVAGAAIFGAALADFQLWLGILVSIATLIFVVLRIAKILKPSWFPYRKKERDEDSED